MTHQNRATQGQARTETSRGHYLLEVLGILCFVLLMLLIGLDVYQGVLNFGSYDTPILGPNFIGPFREHHVDPKGIVGHDFVDANGNNSLASLPFMLVVWVFVPMQTAYFGYLFGVFSLFLFLAAFLTNQFHKWAHMDVPPAFVRWLQARGGILSGDHHDVHHESPYDTYYCITAGFWNPLLDRIGFFERAERLIRRLIPGTDPNLRREREERAD
jgi:plasmanylethanolamine desaturase